MADSAAVVEARQALGRQLAELRKAAGHTQRTFVPQLACYSRSTLASAETGARPAARGFWEQCDDLLSAGGALLDGFDRIEAVVRDERRLRAGRARGTVLERIADADGPPAAPVPAAETPPLVGPGAGGSAGRSLGSGEGPGLYDTDRRGLIGWAAAALGVSGLGASPPALTADDRLALLERAASAAGAVAAVEGILTTIVGDYFNQPPAVVLGRVGALQRLTDAVQADYVLRPADAARLWRVAGVAAGIRGWLENAGDIAAARMSLREACRRGDLLDDDRLVAWARNMQAVVEVYAGDPAAAERLALDGIRRLRRAGAAGGPLRAQLLVNHIAEARANRGDADGVEKAVAQAHGILAALPPAEHSADGGSGARRQTIVDRMDAVSPTYIAESAGLAFARLGQPDRFAEVTADARRDADQAGTTFRVYFRLTEALAVARSPDPDPERVAGLARDGLALADPHQTAHVVDRLGLILGAAKPLGTHPAIRDLADSAAAWRSARLPAAAGLPSIAGGTAG
jgi:hypothetical protein